MIFFLLTKWWGCLHQPPLFIIRPFFTEVCLAQMFDSALEYAFCLLACLDLVQPRKAPFCKNLFLYHFLSFFSFVIEEQPIFFVRK